ncbi:hypothetical protein [Kocuria palustris]|uniref:hypothetical protein n=1 Tax=Kocuria palustris TaxID=71999 RepID=UPI0011A013AA|nr:hypothetical protein [Kocuria palustris]
MHTVPMQRIVVTPDATLQHLRARGAVMLPGRRSDVVARWLGRQRVAAAVLLSLGVVGVLLVPLGAALQEIGLWSLLIPLGVLLAFVGLLAGVGAAVAIRSIGSRWRVEEQPVVLDGLGVSLRGIGPLPWSVLGPPERRRIRVKNDVGGLCPVMPLSPEGRAMVRAQSLWWQRRVGPRPYLRFEVPYLLLPGIDGFTEDQTIELFGRARGLCLRP